MKSLVDSSVGGGIGVLTLDSVSFQNCLDLVDTIGTIGTHVNERIVGGRFEEQRHGFLSTEFQFGHHFDRDGKGDGTRAQIQFVRSHFDNMGFRNHQEGLFQESTGRVGNIS